MARLVKGEVLIELEEALIHLISGRSTSLRYTKQLNLNGYIGANIKGRVLQLLGNLPFELAILVTAAAFGFVVFTKI